MSKRKKEQVQQKLEKFLAKFPEIEADEWLIRRAAWSISEKFLEKLPQMNDERFERLLNRLIDDLLDIMPKLIIPKTVGGGLWKLTDELEAIRHS
jgi:hypothetical protein